MCNFNTYLTSVKNYFNNRISPNMSLCFLKSLRFCDGALPDYSNSLVQAVYIQRYIYAYLYEYKFLYAEVLKNLNVGNKLEVVSLGCGNFVDGYALSQVLPDDCVLDYYGVDCVCWHNRLHLRTGDSLHFMKMDAIDFLRQQQMLTGDVYVFPKSISEFSLEDMRELCTVFGQKKIPKNEISFIFSLRNSNNEEEAKNDLRKTKMLYDVMLESGFITEDDVSNIIRPEQPQRQISEVDKDSSRPLIAIDFINNLPARCNDVKSCACKGCPAYTARQPITTCNYIAGQIFTFRKRGYLQ